MAKKQAQEPFALSVVRGFFEEFRESVEEYTVNYNPQMSYKDEILMALKAADKAISPAKLITTGVRKDDALKEVALNLMMLGKWRISKQIYSFSKVLWKMMLDSDDCQVDATLLKYMPYSCFYVELEGNKDIKGAFIRFYEEREDIASLIFFYDDNPPCLMNFSLSSEQSFKNSVKRAKKDFRTTRKSEQLERVATILIQTCMYLAAKNCDVQENEFHKSIHRERKNIKDKLSEIRKWDVGYRVAQKSHVQKVVLDVCDEDQSEENDKITRRRPRAHTRRAHWHTYLCGEGRKERRLNFLEPIDVNKTDDDEMPAVTHQ